MNQTDTERTTVPPPIYPAASATVCPHCGSMNIDDTLFPVRIEHGLHSTRFSCNDCLRAWVPLPDTESTIAPFRVEE